MLEAHWFTTLRHEPRAVHRAVNFSHVAEPLREENTDQNVEQQHNVESGIVGCGGTLSR